MEDKKEIRFSLSTFLLTLLIENLMMYYGLTTLHLQRRMLLSY